MKRLNGAILFFVGLGISARAATPVVVTQPKQSYKNKTEVNFRFMGFIPKDHEDHPFYALPGVSSTYGGDDRLFNVAAPVRNYRVQEKVSVVPAASISAAGITTDSRQKDTGITNEYHKPTSVDSGLADAINPDGRLTNAAKTDNNLNDGNKKIAISQADDSEMEFDTPVRLNGRKVAVRFHGRAVDPLSLAAGAFGCAAQWDVNVEVDSTDRSNPKYSISGLHVFYPSYEAYLGTQPILQYNVLATSNGPLRMCGPTAAFQGASGVPLQP